MSEVKGLLEVFARFRALGKLEPIPNAQMCLFSEKNPASRSARFSASQWSLAFRFTLHAVTFFPKKPYSTSQMP